MWLQLETVVGRKLTGGGLFDAANNIRGYMKFFNSNATTGEKVFTLGGLILFAVIIIGGIAVVVYKAFPHSDNVNYNCVDFASQNDAQSYFKGQGGSKTNNVDNLDEDGNGIACESLHHINGTQMQDSN